MIELAIVIVNYNAADLTVDCVESLVRDPALPPATQIVVVDNASPDGSAGKLAATLDARAWSGRVTLVDNPVNGGFAHGNNLGIETADRLFGPARYYLLLNPDTVVRRGAVVALRDFLAAAPHVGLAGSRLEDHDGTPQACAFRFPTAASELESSIRLGPVSRLLSRWSVAPKIPARPSRIDWVSGASLMVKREVFDTIGRLDADYFLYYEEVDFCLRAARSGWECWHVPESRVVHLVGQSTGVTRRDAPPARRPAYWFRSRRRYFVKHHGRFYALSADLAWLTGQAGFQIRRVLGRSRNPEPRLITDFLRHSWLAREA